MATSSTSTRSKTNIYLLGSTITELTGNKLPSIRMALGLFLHHHVEMNNTIRESSATTIREITKFWQKARIPVQELRNSQLKLEKLFEKWRLLKKNKNRITVTQKSKEDEFISKFDDLFDIAHANALNMIKISEDKDFLLAQREKGRKGSMLGVDKCLEKKEKMADLRRKAISERNQRMKAVCEEAEATVHLLSSEESDEVENEVEQASFPVTEKGTNSSSKQKRKRMRIMTPNLAAALDRTKVSDRKAVFVVAETVKSLGCEVDEVTLSRSSIRRERIKHRSKMYEQLKAEFGEHVNLTVHWDGKLLQDLTLKEKVDRLPVIVSGKGVSQLLSVPKLPSGDGEGQAAAVYATLQDWGIDDKVSAMCFDTTSVNTGRIKGTCNLLEQKMNKELLSLACRHHIMELIIKAVFEKSLGFSSSPEVPLFKRFQANWNFIDKEKYDMGVGNTEILNQIIDIKDDIINFSKILLDKNKQPRDDYREFLELILIFLGETPSRGVRFMAPGAMHHARWMSKVLYSLKIWMFSSQFTITSREKKGLQKICVFAVRVYLKAWMTAPLPQSAPFNDFNLMKSLLQYKNIDDEISKAASEKLAKHLWYLSEDLVALALFDNQVPHCLKRLIVKAMKDVNCKKESTKRPNITLETFVDMKFEDFVTKRSALLFQQMCLPDAFLQVDPEIWEDQETFCKALEIVKSIKVVNDHAERGIALIQEFCGKITYSETQLQYLLQVVEEHRRTYPDCKKQSLAGTDKYMII